MGNAKGLHMDLFEAIQGMAEYYTDMLHECIESAKTLLKRPIATDHMMNAFLQHRLKVEDTIPRALRGNIG